MSREMTVGSRVGNAVTPEAPPQRSAGRTLHLDPVGEEEPDQHGSRRTSAGRAAPRSRVDLRQILSKPGSLGGRASSEGLQTGWRSLQSTQVRWSGSKQFFLVEHPPFRVKRTVLVLTLKITVDEAAFSLLPRPTPPSPSQQSHVWHWWQVP